MQSFLRRINLFEKCPPFQLRSRVAILLGFACVFFPFIALSFFNHPSADDFVLAAASMKVGFWKAQIGWYNALTGRYFSTALLSINPLVFKSFFLFKVIPLILFIGLFHALYKLIFELIGRSFTNRKEVLLITSVLVTLYIFNMKSVGEGFYWLSGAITYQVPDILMLYLSAYIIRLHRNQQIKMKVIYITLCFILIFAIVGSNEVSMLILLLLLITILILSVYINRRINLILAMFVIAAGIFSYFVISAPGNSIRMTHFHTNQNLLFIVKGTVVCGLINGHLWLFSIPVLVSTILFIPFAANIAAKKIKYQTNSLINPIFFFAASVVILVAVILASYWSSGDSPVGRVLNVMHLFFLMSWFINVYILIEYCVMKNKMTFNQLPKYAVVIMCSFAILSLFSYGGNIRKAYSDLLTGRASRFNKELADRYKMIAKCQSNICEVNKIEDYPSSFYFADITSDAENSYNIRYALYFHKKAIVLKKCYYNEKSIRKTLTYPDFFLK